MHITIKLLFFRLKNDFPDITLYYEQLPTDVLYGVRLLPADVRTCSNTCLYLCDTLDDDQLSSLDPSVYVLHILSAKAAPASLSNVAGIYSAFSLSDLTNQLLLYYAEYADWEHQLAYALLKQAALQELIDISAPIIRSGILIYDPALKLLSFSQTYLPDSNDPIFQFTIENGYLNPQVVHLFEESKAFEKIDTLGELDEGIDQFRQSAASIHDVKLDDQLSMHCVLLYDSAVSPDYIRLLNHILCLYLGQYVKLQQTNFVRNRSVTDYFLYDLLENPQTSPSAIRERMQTLDLDYEGNYIVITLPYTASGTKTARTYFLQYLRNNMVDSRIFFYKGNIVLLYVLLPAFRESYRNYLVSILTPVIASYNHASATIYVSRLFQQMDHFAAAYIQATNMSQFIQSNNNSDITFYFYEDYYLKDLFFENHAINKTFNYCDPVVSSLLEKATPKSTQALSILYEYLNNDRKLTVVAKKLHMHRNNVLYHIEQLSTRYNLDLDDPAVRLRLLLSFELIGFSPD